MHDVPTGSCSRCTSPRRGRARGPATGLSSCGWTGSRSAACGPVSASSLPTAGRPFTPELVPRLVSRGVLLAPVTLHTGVSSPERHEAPYPERFRVPPETARLVNAVHGWGGRVIAVGTTVVRALESVAGPE